jgi:hypothetical protein
MIVLNGGGGRLGDQGLLARNPRRPLFVIVAFNAFGASWATGSPLGAHFAAKLRFAAPRKLKALAFIFGRSVGGVSRSRHRQADHPAAPSCSRQYCRA